MLSCIEHSHLIPRKNRTIDLDLISIHEYKNKLNLGSTNLIQYCKNRKRKLFDAKKKKKYDTNDFAQDRTGDVVRVKHMP